MVPVLLAWDAVGGHSMQLPDYMAVAHRARIRSVFRLVLSGRAWSATSRMPVGAPANQAGACRACLHARQDAVAGGAWVATRGSPQLVPSDLAIAAHTPVGALRNVHSLWAWPATSAIFGHFHIDAWETLVGVLMAQGHRVLHCRRLVPALRAWQALLAVFRDLPAAIRTIAQLTIKPFEATHVLSWQLLLGAIFGLVLGPVLGAAVGAAL
mmetsp:Transcript_66057/g.191378  ORF Transcript_66057/g.191378 Transcript_66057/m.191378 type:complete len:211 (-) Transcript_66057:271-903(-)